MAYSVIRFSDTKTRRFIKSEPGGRKQTNAYNALIKALGS